MSVELPSVLLIEDNPADVRYVREMLAEGNAAGAMGAGPGSGNSRFEMSHAGRLGDAIQMLETLKVDAILLDLSLPDAQGITTVRQVRAAVPHVPIIVLTGSNDEALAVLTLREGAQDYLVKGRLEHDILIRSMRYAIERHSADRQRRSLVAELDHRVKNNLATVLAMADQSLRSVQSLVEFKESFTGRIRAMARVHTVLANSQWQGAELSALVCMSLEPYQNKDSVVIEGGDVWLSARAACVLCMAFNELATNAAKYGAFSTAEGRVHVRWNVLESAGADDTLPRRLVLDWVESGGPPITGPIKRGLGSDLIDGSIPYELNGKVEFAFPVEGARLRIDVPLDDVDRTLAPGMVQISPLGRPRPQGGRPGRTPASGPDL